MAQRFRIYFFQLHYGSVGIAECLEIGHIFSGPAVPPFVKLNTFIDLGTNVFFPETIGRYEACSGTINTSPVAQGTIAVRTGKTSID
jgi:hypothetical protein